MKQLQSGFEPRLLDRDSGILTQRYRAPPYVLEKFPFMASAKQYRGGALSLSKICKKKHYFLQFGKYVFKNIQDHCHRLRNIQRFLNNVIKFTTILEHLVIRMNPGISPDVLGVEVDDGTDEIVLHHDASDHLPIGRVLAE